MGLLKNNFKPLAHAEGVSFLLILFVTMPLKYGLGIGWPNKVIGMIHGFLFILFLVAVMALAVKEKWSFKLIVLALLASIFPFGTFIFTRYFYDEGVHA